MKKPVRRAGFYYDLPDKNENTGYPSVTTILKILDKPALKRWTAQQIYDFCMANPDASFEEAMGAPYKKMKTAGGEGTMAHDIIDAHWKGRGYDKSGLSGKVLEYINAFELFCHDLNPECVESEGVVYSDKEKYAGTYDGIFKIDGERWLIDWKTSNYIVREHEIQLVAYAVALKEMGIKVDRMAIVQLKNDETYNLVNVKQNAVNVLGEPVDLYEAFLAAKTLFNAKLLLA